MGQPRIIAIDWRRKGTADLAPEIWAALARLAEGHDEETCFVFTRAGVLRARADAADPTTFHLCSGDAIEPAMDCRTPRWDDNARVLSVGGQIVKRFKQLSPNQEAVLMAFEEEGWPCRIDDPLSPVSGIAPKVRLHDTIKWLNRNQENRLVNFSGDGTGQGVRWDILVADTLPIFAGASSRVRAAA